MTEAATETWTVMRRRISHQRAAGQRPLPLGRNIVHDSRSRAYPWKRASGALVLKSVLHSRHITILDQGDVGSCTGNAETGALGTDPLFGTLPSAHPLLTEAEALTLYSAAEVIDGDGPYPPNDHGSSGLSVCKAAKRAGLISGYLHCFSMTDVLDALQATSLIVGTNWYDSMDKPDGNGLVTIAPHAVVRGGHEYLVRGIDIAAQTVWADNSWSAAWGNGGSFLIGWATLERLLSEQGDATISVPLTQPAPVPVPVPVPVPESPAGLAADIKLAAAVKPWVAVDRQRQDLVQLRGNLQDWLAVRGF